VLQLPAMPAYISEEARKQWAIKTAVDAATDTWLREQASEADITVSEVIRRLIATAMEEDNAPRTRRRTRRRV
jgi:short-subunit dehydrogenase involved in D-alanine esterification of teichoic acids